MLDRMTWGEPPWRGSGQWPSAAPKQAMKRGNKGVGMDGKLEISSQGLRGQNSLEMGEER